MIKALALLCVVGYASAFDFCGICEAGVNEVIKYAANNEGKAKQLLDAQCKSHLSHSWEVDICDSACNLAVGEIIKYIKSGLNAQAICGKVHLCSGLTPLESAINNKAGSNQICAICNKIVQTADADGEQIVAVCERLTASQPQFSNLCGYLQKILRYISATNVCKFVPGCGNGLENLEFPRQMPVQAQKANLCPYCEEAIGVIENLLKNEVPTIVNDIKALCQKLPGEEAEICSSLVDQYGSMILDKVLGLLNPQKVCTGIHLCSSSLEDLDMSELATVGDGVDWDPVKCNFCKMVFGFVQQNFMSTDFINALLKDIAKACKDIDSASVQQQCLNIIATYGDMILNYAKSLISPDHICPMIKMCPSS